MKETYNTPQLLRCYGLLIVLKETGYRCKASQRVRLGREGGREGGKKKEIESESKNLRDDEKSSSIVN